MRSVCCGNWDNKKDKLLRNSTFFHALAMTSQTSKTYYRKRFLYCAWGTFGEREREIQTDRQRERERDGSDVTIVALKLAMNSHFPLPKIRNWRWAYTFPCQKFALLVSPFTHPVSPFTERLPLWRWKLQWVHTFQCQNFFRPLCSPSFKWHEPRDEWSKTQDQILPSPILFFPSKKWIKLIPKTIGNRKRDCAWGGSGW